MIVIFNNKGILVPVFLFVSFVFVGFVNYFLIEVLHIEAIKNSDPQISFAIVFFISSFWTYIKSKDYIIVEGSKEEMYSNNHFFYISMKLWSYIKFGISILIFLSVYFN